MWPADARRLVAEQYELAAAEPGVWHPGAQPPLVCGCWVCFPRGLTGSGEAGDAAWAAAVTMRGARVTERTRLTGTATAPYTPGLLALRLGSLLERAVRELSVTPDVVLLDATGRDHPRGAGLALHLGAVLDLPSIGVTHRPLLAHGTWPVDRTGATADLRIDGAVVARWLRTRSGTRPLAVHPGWRVTLQDAVDLVAAGPGHHRTPEPLRRAREVARRARAGP